MIQPSSATTAAIRFRFYLFGVFHIESERGPVRLPRHKVESLLAYLLLHSEKHSREKLAALFWGDFPDAEARHSLRTALTTLRTYLDPNLLLTDRETIQFNPNYPVWIDVVEFQKQLDLNSQLSDLEVSVLSDQAATSRLQSAIRLYQGDLLVDFYDDWILLERDQYRVRYLEVLLRLTQEMRTRSEYEQAITLAQQVLASDLTNERAHQHLMFCFVASGDRSAALKQYETCRRLLQEELGVEPLPETTALFQWIKGTPSEGGALEARLTNLPIPLTSFIGRQRELAEIKQLLIPLSQSGRGARGEGSRLLTLTGAGGSGKTRLAIQTATELVDAFKDGVWWVELAALAEGTLVSQAVAKALSVPEVSNQPLIEILINFLQPRQLLLVLDNCEHLLHACAHLAAELLGACPQLQILATSREALGLTGEVAWPVPTLSVPDRPDVSPRQLLRQFESTRLFVERAGAVKPDFDLTLQNAPAVTEICQRLDGIPLAIELAAARVKALSVEQIAARLDDRFNLLTQGSRTALPRHQTLRSTIDWSYDLLTEPERALFRRLSVFAGGFTLETAEAVASDVVGQDAILSYNVLDLLSHLVDKSIVVVEHQEDITRYRLLETIRQYAWEKLSESGELEQQRSRHLAFFLHWAAEAEPKLRSAEQLIWLQRLKTEHDNLRAALQWAQETGEVETMLRLTGALFWFWVLHSYLGEGRGWLEQALAAGEVSVPTSVRAQAFYGAAYLARVQGDFAGARRLVEQSIEMWRVLNPADKSGLAHALVLLGWLMRDEGDPATGRSIIEEGVALLREQGDAWGLAWSLTRLGLVIRDQEDYALARSIIEESVPTWRELGDVWGLAEALHNLGLVAYRRGDYEAAYSVMEEALSIRRRLGDKQQIAYSLHNLGVFTLAQGDPERAKSFFEQDLVRFREVGDKSGIVLALQYQGLYAQLQGDEAQAQSFFEEGLKLAQETGPRWVSSNYLLGLAGVAAGRDQLERAARLCGAATANLAASASFWDAFECSYYERTVALARAGLGEAAFALAEAEGQAMTLEQAVAYALQKETP
jgi:predicted ATPase/DNA-binding SARP family transcriptional activator